MKCGSYREIHEHKGVTRVAMSTPRAVRSEFLEGGRNPEGISAKMKSYPFQNSCNDVTDVCRQNISAGIVDSVAPFARIARSKLFPVVLENAHSGFTLVDVFAVTECHRSHRVPSKTLK